MKLFKRLIRQLINQLKTKLNKKQLLLIDGYNLLWAINDFRRITLKDRKQARDLLIETINGYDGEYHKVIVFDGKGDLNEYRYQSVDVIYTGGNTKADSYIVKSVKKSKHQFVSVSVVTSDKQLGSFVTRHGAELIRVHKFKEMLNIDM